MRSWPPPSWLAQAAQRSCDCPLPGSVQSQAGWGSEQPGLVEGVPAHGRGVGTGWSLQSLPTQTSLWVYGPTTIKMTSLKDSGMPALIKWASMRKFRRGHPTYWAMLTLRLQCIYVYSKPHVIEINWKEWLSNKRARFMLNRNQSRFTTKNERKWRW